ncbi:MAG TPA: MEKHLA domain-containing protein [Nitrospiria bacterium]
MPDHPPSFPPTADVTKHVGLLLHSHIRLTGQELLPMTGTPIELAGRLFNAPFVVLSHGKQADPVLSYGNRAALTLWEMSWEEFTSTPSRLTAEAMDQAERARMLAEAAKQGWIKGYHGVRRSKTGKRFHFEDAILWNLVDAQGQYLGQAAMFKRWGYL